MMRKMVIVVIDYDGVMIANDEKCTKITIKTC